MALKRPEGDSVDIAYQSISADWVERADAALAMLVDHRVRLACKRSGLRNQRNSDSRNRPKMTTAKVVAALRKIRASGESFSSERKLGKRLGCGARTVGKAVASDIGLRAWRKQSDQHKPRAVGHAHDEMPAPEKDDEGDTGEEGYDPASWQRLLVLTERKYGPAARRKLEEMDPKWRAERLGQLRDSANRIEKKMG